MSRQHSSALVAGVLAVGFLVMFLSSAIKGLYQVYFVDLAAHFGGGRSGLALGGDIVCPDHWPRFASGGRVER